MTTGKRIGLSPAHFSDAFPFHFAFDSTFAFVTIGTSLQRILTDASLGAPIVDHLDFQRPSLPSTAEALAEHFQTLFLIDCRKSHVTLRGQIVQSEPGEFLFIGSPWFAESEELTAAGLGIADFAIHDPAVDHLQLLQSQKMAFQDLREFANRLKKQQAALRHQEAEARKLAHVAARTDNAVIITDANGLTEWVNDGFTKQTGYVLADIQGKKPGHLLQGSDTDPETVREMSERIEAGEAFQIEILNYTKTREARWIEIEVQPIRDRDDKIINFVAIETDITQRKLTEESLRRAKQDAEKASRMKSEFLATVSHEIRTPMNGILGLSELLIGSELNPKQRSLLQSIRSSASSLVTVINDVLDLSKIESGKVELHPEPFEIRPLVDAVLETVADRCAQRNVGVAAIIAPEVPSHLVGDHSKLSQILINLLGNASKFTEEGHIRFEISETFRDRTQSILEFKIRDTGIGFDPAEAQQLFQSFRQSDSGPARRHGGTGLGLSISKQLTELLQGTIDAHGELGVGATFTCKLPFSLLDGQDVKTPYAFPPDRLVVSLTDIDPLSAAAIANHLKHWGLPCVSPDTARQTSDDTATAPIHVNIRSESAPAPQSADTTITLTRLNSQDDIEADENILIRPVRFGQLRTALIHLVAPEQIQPSPSAFPGSDTTSGKPRYQELLIAEDNPINQQLMREILQRLGLNAKIVENGREVIKAIQDRPYDCILMDCQMPELDGYDTTRRIRELESEDPEEAPRTRIIAMTANALFGDREKCLEAGMDDYMAKPICLDDVRQKLMCSAPPDGTEPPPASPPNEDQHDIEAQLDILETDLGMEAVSMLVEEVLGDCPGRLSQMREMAQGDDRETLKREAHSLKSVCRTYGLTEAANLAQDLELAAGTSDPTPLASLVESMTAAYERDAAILAQALEARTPDSDAPS